MRSRLLAVACNQVAFFIFGLVGIRLLTHAVDPVLYNDYQVYFLTVAPLGFLVTHSGITNFASRNWQREQGRKTKFIRFLWRESWNQSLHLTWVLGLIVIAVSAVERNWSVLGILPLLFISAYVGALAAEANLVLNAAERHWAIFVLSSGGAAAKALLPVGMVIYFGASLNALGIGFTIQSLIVLGVILFCFRGVADDSEADRETEAAWHEELRRYGRPFMVLGIGAWLLQFADRWVVTLLFDKERAATFTLATSLSSYVPTVIMASLMQIVFPGIFRRADAAKTKADWRDIARRCDYANWTYIGVTCVGLVFLALTGRHLVGLLIRDEYAPAISLVIPAGMAALASQANQFQFLLLQGRHDSKAMVKVTLILAGIKTVGSVVAAMISWGAFLAWLGVSLVICTLLGRYLIRRMALAGLATTVPTG